MSQHANAFSVQSAPRVAESETRIDRKANSRNQAGRAPKEPSYPVSKVSNSRIHTSLDMSEIKRSRVSTPMSVKAIQGWIKEKGFDGTLTRKQRDAANAKRNSLIT